MERVCVLCGKKFNTSSSRRLRCYDRHTRKCAVCGKEFELKNCSDVINPITCSEPCRKVQISRTCSKRDPMFECTCTICGKKFLSHSKISDVCYDQHEATCENCGKVFYPSRQYFLYRRKTCSEKCRYELSNKSFMENFDIHKAKIDQTMLELYGDTSPARIPQFIEKRYATNESRYGAKHFAQSVYFKERCIQTNRERYNVDWYQQTDEFKERAKLTLLIKYNVDNYFKSKEFMLNSVRDPSCIENLFEFKEDPDKFVRSHFQYTPTLAELSKVLGIVDSSVGYLMRQMGCSHLAKHSYSKMEEEVVEFLKNYLSESEIIQNTKAVITPLEIDIYIPDLGFGIECNPAWTHNSSVGCFNSDPIGPDYHQYKSDLARDKGLFVFHLFGYDWKYQRYKCEDLIKKFIKHSDVVLDAVKLSIGVVSIDDAKEFLITNSLLNLPFDYAMGLYDDSTLYAIMTFQSAEETWFLSEYCSKVDTYVHHGASCLLCNFVIKYEIKEIYFYSDRSYVPDNFCISLGFHAVTDLEPRSKWVDLDKEFPVDDLVDSHNSHRVVGQVFDAGRTLWIKQIGGGAR